MCAVDLMLKVAIIIQLGDKKLLLAWHLLPNLHEITRLYNLTIINNVTLHTLRLHAEICYANGSFFQLNRNLIKIVNFF